MRWEDIKGYEGIYQISDTGLCRNIKKNKLLSIRKITSGYIGYYLCKNGYCKNFKAHRIVAESFIDNPKNKKNVNHIDGVKSNNHYLNLEWVTCKENTTHAIDNNLINIEKIKQMCSKLGKKTCISNCRTRIVLTQDEVLKIRNEMSFKSRKQLMEEYSLKSTTYHRIKTNTYTRLEKRQ